MSEACLSQSALSHLLTQPPSVVVRVGYGNLKDIEATRDDESCTQWLVVPHKAPLRLLLELGLNRMIAPDDSLSRGMCDNARRDASSSLLEEPKIAPVGKSGSAQRHSQLSIASYSREMAC